jgi:hypothetical protein
MLFVLPLSRFNAVFHVNKEVREKLSIAHYNVWFKNAPDHFHMSACRHVTAQKALTGFS